MYKNTPSPDHLDHIFSIFRHELGNTVNSLKITLEVLLNNYAGFSDQKRIEFIERSMEQVDRQHHLLDKMKAYAHATVDDIQTIPLLSFWNELIQLIRSKTHKTPIAFNHQIAASHVLIKASLSATQQLLDHILNNAIDALEGIDSPQIDMEASISGAHLILHIQDNGPGIVPDVLPKVVLPFFSTRSDRNGMGLSIASKLMHQMGGQLLISSTPGKGAVATLQFPILHNQANINGSIFI
jgi:signal transduction histidine kinase